MGNIIDLQGKFVIDKGDKAIHLVWSYPVGEFQPEETGNLYVSLTSSTPTTKVAEIPLSIGQFKYPIDNFFSKTYRLKLGMARIGNDIFSNTIAVPVPTLDLPKPRITTIGNSRRGLLVEWAFPFNISDMQGFQLHMNESKVLSISKWTRQVYIQNQANPSVKLQIKAVASHAISQSKPVYFKLNLL